MDCFEVIGFRSCEFSFKDGSTCKGLNLYVRYDMDGVIGVACERVFVPNSKVGSYSPAIGDIIRIFYNRFGKVSGVEKV